MKNICLLITTLFILFGFNLSATNYYLSPNGNDSNNGTSISTPWRTIDRLQSLEYVLLPGDKILLERGGVYSGQITINSSGNSNSPITIEPYGIGDLPEITGSINPSGWVVYQGNIWMVPVPQSVKYLRVNEDMMTLARYPNVGWLRVNTSSNTSINSSGLTQTNGYWIGSEVVIRTTGWCYENGVVDGFSNGTITYPSTVYNPGNYNWGFFMQNKLSELDSPGEWFHDNINGVLYFQAPSNANPNNLNVRASVYENGVNVGWQRSYVDIKDIKFSGQKFAGVNNGGSNHVNITGCDFLQNKHGIRSYGSYDNYSNNTIRNTFATGLVSIDNNTIISNNLIENIALIPGLGEPFWGYYGMYALGQDNTTSNNKIDNVGNSGIFIDGSGIVEKNVISRALATVNDGGGIYFDNANGLIIQDNFISNIDPNLESLAMDHPVNYKLAHGIYFGNAAIHDVIVRRNTVSGCRGAGINVDHTMISSGIQILNNVLYDNDIQLSITDFSNYNTPGGAVYPYYVSNYDDIYSGNTLYCTNKDQHCMQQYLVNGPIPVDFGTHTNNRYFNPFNEQSIFIINVQASSVRHMNLDHWRFGNGEESGSTISPHRQNNHEVVSRISPNLVNNGNFEYNTNGWSGWPTSGQLSRDFTYLDNGSLKVIYNQSTESSEFYLRNDLMSMVSGEWYEMRFSTQSSLRGILRAEFKSQSQSSGPYSMSSREVGFSPQRRDIQITFQYNSPEYGLMIFANKFFESTYWIDNVELYRVNTVYVDPYDRHILLENKSESQATLNLLDGCWMDVNSSIYVGSIDLNPWSSIVLSKEDPIVCNLTTDIPNKKPEKEIGIYPIPIRSGGKLFLTSPIESNVIVELVDVSGRVIQQSSMLSGSFELPIDSNIPKGYYIVSLKGPEINQYRIVIQ